ncbi:MAG: DUF364 domain-containing protein [Candidatus Hadarchaeota archaeon]
MIIDELLSLIEKRRSQLENLKLLRVCVSLCYTAVMLDNDYVGLCHTPTEDIAHSHWGRRRDLHGSKALETARRANSFDMIEKTVGIATLNALSQHLMDSEGYERKFDVDIFDALDVRANDTVAVVGYIRPLVGKLREKGCAVHVFERNPQLRGDALPDTFADSVLPKVDVVIASGSSLANGTIDKILESSKNARFVAVTGPSAGTLPEPFFERGVKVIAGVRAKGEGVVNAVAEAKHFVAFKELVEKYVMKKD